MNKPVILCVDDEPTVLDSLEIELSKYLGDKYSIEMAEDSEEALELVEELLKNQQDIAVVIADYIMPKIKGDELLKRIHTISPKTLKILLTGQADLDAVTNAINYAKLYRYIAKPWQSEDLILTVKEAIHSYFQEKKLAEKNAKLQFLNQELEQLNQAQAELIAQLHQAEQKYRRIFENALEGIFQSTPDGRYISVNCALAQIYGYDSPEALMTSLSHTQHQLYVEPQRHTEFLEVMQQQGEVSDFESRVYRQDGSIIWISESARAVYDSNGSTLYYQGFVEDITERKKAETERIKFTEELFQLNQAFSCFVPRQFLQCLNKKSIVDVQLGDSVQQEMSVLFSDIRDFTTLSEQMTPQENFKFINTYLSRMEPAIIDNHGFIDKYMGDGIMALFSGIADDAVKAGIAMLQRLTQYNQHRSNSGYAPIRIGIGINTGSLMLGTVGGQNRMDGTVISDDVNLASRLETLTKEYGVSLLITHQTFARLHHPTDYNIRFIDKVTVKGKSKAVAVFEVFDGDEPDIIANKLATKSCLEEGLFFYHQKNYSEAAERFERVSNINPRDRVAQIYRARCQSQVTKMRSPPLSE